MNIEPSDLIVGLLMTAFGLIGLILASGAYDDVMYVFGLSLFGFACVFVVGLVIFGSMIIISNLNHNMMPMDQLMRMQR